MSQLSPTNQPTKGILYYSDNCLNMKLSKTCRKFIAASGLPITSVTLKPTNFGRNICLPLPRGYRSMYQQIMTGLENITEDIVIFTEHDILYHKNHFEFTPPRDDVFYYNGNYWMLRLSDGFAVHYDVSPLSGLVAYREPLLIHFRERMEYVKKHASAYWIGWEPFTNHRVPWKTWYEFEVFEPEFPNIDLCHGGNLTRKRWTTQKFIKKPIFWEESTIDNINGWPNLRDICSPFFPLKDGMKSNV